MKKLWRILAILLVITLVIGGCSKKVKEEPAVTSADVKTAVSTAVASDTKKDSAETNAAEVRGSASTEEVAELPKTDVSWDVPDAVGEAVDDTAFTYATDDYVAAESKAKTSDGGVYDYETGEGSLSWSEAADFEAPMDVAPGLFIAEEPAAWDIDPYDPIVIDDPTIPIISDDPYMPTPTPAPYILPRAGLLTAGEWNDNKNFDFLRALLKDGQNFDYSNFFKDWGLTPFTRIQLRITEAEGRALQGAYVTVSDMNGSVIRTVVSDHEGMCYVYYNLKGENGIPAKADVSFKGETASVELTSDALLEGTVTEININATRAAKALDLMLVVDTTGSMGDEISYLQAELDDVVSRVSRMNANLPVNLSVNFYRDLEDDYVVRSYPFSYNINEQMSYLRAEYANGGGDYEEAVELALNDAVNGHVWDEDAVKIMFLVLDAPPHLNENVKASLSATIDAASAQGIRIIPVAASGVDKSTEFLLRTLAMTTGGTYTFLTNDSGIGGDHIEPTIGHYDVEQLNDLMVRVINEYLQ